jgi:AcrR family transcriptional regulator
MSDPLWAPRAGGSRGPKRALTLERIADAAVDVADAEGLGAVSMQRVATAVGVTKMALYRYLPGKNDLVAVMVERALGAAPDLGGAAWRAGLGTWAAELFAAHLRHPWTLEAVLLPRPLGPNELSWMEAATAVLAGTGLTGAERLDTLAALTGQVRVIAQQARTATDPEGQFVAAVATVLARHADDFPTLAQTMAEAAAAGSNQAFGFGVERILDGLQALLDERRGPPPLR